MEKESYKSSVKVKIIEKLEIIFIYTGKYRGAAAHRVYNSKFNVINEIPVVFHNVSDYDNYFIIKELANEFGGQFECLGENTKKYKTLSFPIEEKIVKIDKDGYDSVLTTSYKIKFVESARFMATSLSNLVDNLTGESHKIKCKDCGCFLEYESSKDTVTKYKCLSCNKDYLKKIDKEIKRRLKNTFKFSD